MPKDKRVHHMELQEQRKRQKVTITKFAPSKIILQVIGNGARGEARSVMLSTDHTNYLFNCGEGTQRLAHEHRAKLAKLEHVFITNKVWYNMSGLPGMALTMQDAGVSNLTLHGPSGITDLFEGAKKFVLLEALKLIEADTSESFVDHVMAVTYIPLLDDVMAYVCKIHPKLGTLDLEKCREKGVPSGPFLGKLKSGHDVVLENGNVVRSAEVVSPSEPGPIVAVVEVPSEEYLTALENNENLKGIFKGSSNVSKYVIHFSPADMLRNKNYQNWMMKLGEHTEHLIINESNGGFSSEAMHRMQHQLHLIHPKIFPLLSSKEKNGIDMCSFLNKKIYQCDTLHTVHLRPNKGHDPDSQVTITPDCYVQELKTIDGFLDSLAELQANINGKSKVVDNSNQYPKVLMLGTGSSIPNKFRNTSGILLQLAPDTSIILDCGESTFSQLFKFFGSKVDEILKSIKAIYISHIHADHHLGLLGILNERSKLTTDPLYLLAPDQVNDWLNFYDAQFEAVCSYFKFVSNEEFRINNLNTNYTIDTETLYNNLNLCKIVTEFVDHCFRAYGIAITLKNGKVIVYSGDTRPTNKLVALSKNCDLLIHEATMEDGLEEEAKVKAHSTISQAIKIGVEAEAKFTLLNHFSQRYSKLPILTEKGGINLSKVGIAHDFMYLTLPELELLPLFYPTLKLMFTEFMAILNEKAQKRENKKEKLANS